MIPSCPNCGWRTRTTHYYNVSQLGTSATPDRRVTISRCIGSPWFTSPDLPSVSPCGWFRWTHNQRAAS